MQVNLVAIKSAYFRRKPIYPLSFFANTPFKGTIDVILSDHLFKIVTRPVRSQRYLYNPYLIKNGKVILGIQFFYYSKGVSRPNSILKLQ